MRHFFLLSLLVFASSLFSYEIIEELAKIPILTPSLAERKTAKLRLDNGLEAYLISDPGYSQSAAALSVEVGSWHDPEEYPGMAHFLEHMLFMGTKAFPDESEYSAFIRDHGGNDNAFTSTDRTIYVFSADHKAFPYALERFSHFFIDPLFSIASVEKELHAVDEEYAMCIGEDDWRKWMILKETGNPSHPNRAFCIGNKETLQKIPRASLEAWHQKNYQAHQMHLSVISSLPLEQLITLADQLFSPIASETKEKSSLFPTPLLSEKQKGHMIYVNPLGNVIQLELVWEVPLKFAQDKERRAVELTAFALEHAAEQGLYHLLKKEKLAKSVQTSLDPVSRDHLLLTCEITLTEKGLGELEKTISYCFQAIARLKEKGVPFYLFEEHEHLCQMIYQYQSLADPFDTALFHAEHLIEEPLASHPEKTLIPSCYDPSFILEFIHTLTPQNCLFMLSIDPLLIDLETEYIEKWTGAEYSIQPIPEQKLLAWSLLGPHPEIDLPPPNPYLPHPSLKEKTTVGLFPFLIEETEGSKIYFVEDTTYLVPEVISLFSFYSPLLDGSVKSELLLHLYFKAFFNALSQSGYFAREAGIIYNFSYEKNKVNLEIEGFSDQVPFLLKEIFKSLPQVSFSQDNFEENKHLLTSYLDNNLPPIEKAGELISSVLFTDSSTKKQKKSVLKEITYQQFKEFSEELFKHLHVEGLLCGNLTQTEAEILWKELQHLLAFRPYAIEKTDLTSFSLSEKERKIIEQDHGEAGNATVLALHQGSFSLERRGVQKILSKALEEAFFDALRTKQQMGYLVKSWDEIIAKELFQFFAVHSSNHDPHDLLSRFDDFLKDFTAQLSKKIPENRFEILRQHLILLLQTPAENLSGYARELYSLAFSKSGDLSWYMRYADSLQELSYSRFMEIAQEILSIERASVAVLIRGSQQ